MLHLVCVPCGLLGDIQPAPTPNESSPVIDFSGDLILDLATTLRNGGARIAHGQAISIERAPWQVEISVLMLCGAFSLACDLGTMIQ